MNCNNCTNNNALKEVKIKHVHGNVLRMAIPLTLRTIELVDGEINATDSPFVPSSEHPVKVVFSKGSVSVALDATMKDGNIAYIEEKGKIPVGTYAITVTCNDDNGNPYRFKQNAVLYVADATIEAGIEETIEYEVTTWYLDAAIFLALKGEDGVGIDDIETQSSGEIGGVNTVTFILTDGRTRSFDILNGSGAVDSDLDINSPSPIANSAVTAKFNELSGELADLFGDVDYDTSSKSIRFWDKGKTNILASLDARPFIKDGMVSNAYISNNTLVITFNTDSGKEAIGVPLTTVFNPNNYYTKTQVDSRIASAVANINLTNYYTKSQTDTMVSRITPYEVTFTTGNNSNIVCDHTIANIYQNYTNHKPIIAKYGESVGTLVYIKGGENPEAAFLFGDRFDSPYLLRNGVSGWGKEELGADIEVEPWPSIESDKPVASDGVAAALAQKVSSVTINGTTKTPDEDGDVSFTVEGGSGGYEPPVGGIPKSDLAQSVQDTLDDVSNKVDKVAGKGLSTEDYTTAEKQKLAGLSNYDDTEIQAEVDAKYEKPSTGIPKSDLASDVQASLGKADTALQSSDLDGYATTDDVDDAVAALVSSAPQTLDTLNELAEALGGDPNFATTMATQLGNKVDKESGKSLMTDAERTKLQGIAEGAEVNVQPNWTQTNTSADDYIKNKPTLANVATSGSYNDLQDKPTIPDVSGFATTAAMNTALAGKQNTLTFDNAPTAGSNNPVKSGGIKTAIDNVMPTINENGKWVIGGVTTDKDAQGPRGNTILVNENAQGIQALIVNNVGDGGETDILSAEMGKVIRQNIMRIFNALGTYAFPEGKPVLNWGSTVINHSINVNGVSGLTISDVEVDGTSVGSLPAQVVDGKSLSLKLNLPTGMYLFDGVAITMGGVAITNNTGVWDESTGTIYISSVTGDISITAAAVLDPINNYAEQSHLVFQLDGLHKGPTAGKWTDLKGGVVWDNHGATELDDCWQFDGSSYLDSQNMVAHEPRTCTIEVAIDSGLTNQHYFVFTDGSKMVLYYYNNYQNLDIWASRGHTNSTGYGGITTSHLTSPDNGNGKKIVSVTGNNTGTVGGKVNGVSRIATSTNYGAGPKAIIGGVWNATNNELRMQFTGKVYAIRIYDTILSEADMLANQRLDNQRFNLGLTI